MATPAVINELIATSRIEAVTVYESSAQVHRHTKVTLPTGFSCIVFKDLPSNIDRDSLQVGLAGEQPPTFEAGSVTLRGIVFNLRREDNKERPVQEQAQMDASKKIDVLQLQLKEVDDQMQMVKRKEALNQKTLQNATGAASGAGAALFEVQTWETLLTTVLTANEALLAEQRALEERRKALEAELQLAQKIKNQFISEKIAYSVVEVTLVATQAVEALELVVSYVVNAAYWHPEYEVRVSENAEAQLVCNGMVHQATEEAWNGAILTFSTAKPSLNGRQPELQPWRVDFRKKVVIHREVRSKGMKMMKSKKMSSSSSRMEDTCKNSLDDDEDCEEGVEELLVCDEAPVIESAVASESATSLSFTVSRAVTVPANGEQIRCPLFTWDLTCTFEFHTVPSLAEAVYATAVAKNTGSFPLQPGTAAIFFNGQYVCTAHIPRTAVNENIRVSVGRDDSISVKFKLVTRQRADHTSGLLQYKKDKTTMKYVTTLKNTKKEPVTVKVMGRIPMSDTDELTVTLVEPEMGKLSEEAAKKVQHQGFVEEEVKISPQVATDVPLSFTVVSPQGATVYGL